MAKEKVASVEEQMEMFRKEITEKATSFEEGLNDRVMNVDKVKPIDYSARVNEKITKDGCSYSGLKKFRESPLTYAESLLRPFTQTPAMFEGQVVDDLITKKEEFLKKYYLLPENVARNSNEGKAKFALYWEMAKGRIVLEQETFEKAMAKVEALWKNDDCAYYMRRMKTPQKYISFVHRETGIKMRGILDWDSEENDPEFQFFLADLKTTKDASTDGFKREAANLWYNGQVGVYTMAYKYQWKFPDFIHVVVENKEPYNTNVFRSSAQYIKDAQEEVHNTLVAFKYCMDNNLWHKSYNFILDGVLRYQELSLPGYYKSPYFSRS